MFSSKLVPRPRRAASSRPGLPLVRSPKGVNACPSRGAGPTAASSLGPLSARTHAPSVSTSCAPHNHAVLYIKVLMLFYEFWILVYKP